VQWTGFGGPRLSAQPGDARERGLLRDVAGEVHGAIAVDAEVHGLAEG